MNKSVSLTGELSFKQWVDDLNNSLSDFTIPVFSDVESNWRIWVQNFKSVNPKYIITLPTQSTWQEWVSFFINDINHV